MSRSRKKHPVIYYEKDDVKYANRRIRRDKDTEFKTPSAFKRFSHVDVWKNYWTRKDAIEQWHRREYLQQQYSLEEWLKYWEKCAIRK